MNESKANVGVHKVKMHLQNAQNRLLIKDGTVVNDDQKFRADVYVEDGCIKQVGTNLTVPGGVRTIDAKGLLVIPGGIDPHTHMELPFMGTVSSESFYSGTRAALAGGTTMIIDFVFSGRGDSLIDRFQEYREKADPQVCCDYALHVIVTEFNEKVAAQMTELTEKHGVNSYKCFMAYPSIFMIEDDDMYRMFAHCKKLGALPMVHAENGKVIVERARELIEQLGVTGPEGHMWSRPASVEAEATHRAVMLAGQANSPLYVVHVMSREASDEIRAGRHAGQVVFGEAVASALGTDGRQLLHHCWTHAAAHVMSPSLSEDPATPAYLMRQLADNQLQTSGSDHAVFRSDQKALGKDDFRKIPNGVNGVEDRMSVVWERGVATGELDACRFVAVTSTNAAKIFNLYPRKGRIAVGSDADIVLWHPEKQRTISAATHHQNVDFNVFEGMRCHGVPEMVICGGRVVVEQSEQSAGGEGSQLQLRMAQGQGRYVACEPHCDHVFSRVVFRDGLLAAKFQPVQREPYTGPVVDVTGDAAGGGAGEAAGGGATDTTASSQSAGGGRGGGVGGDGGHSRPKTSSGGRNMQDTSFQLGDDRRDQNGKGGDGAPPVRTSIKTKQPPGGASQATSFW